LMLEANGQIVTYKEIIEAVWPDAGYGVDASRVNQHVKKLRELFAQYSPDVEYFENFRGRGYRFLGKVVAERPLDKSPTNIQTELKSLESEDRSPSNHPPVRTGFRRWLGVAIGVVLLLASGLVAWKLYHGNDEEAIRKVVRDSQMYESLVLYKNPSAFKEEDFDKYWATELDVNTNYDGRRIRESVKKLLDEGRHYGDETRCEQFEFQSVEIDKSGDMALVKTLEKWFIAVYFNDGTLQKNKYVGPYFVSYVLRKIDGRWLIEKSNTARMSRPTPVLTKIEPLSDMKSGEQFNVRLTGQDFEGETVQIELTGPGCPESKPCKVPNSALRENSKLSDTVLDHVPLTLASGDFKIIIYNGDSKPSNAVQFTVP